MEMIKELNAEAFMCLLTYLNLQIELYKKRVGII